MDSSVKIILSLTQRIYYRKKESEIFLCLAKVYQNMVSFHSFFAVMRILRIRREQLFKEKKEKNFRLFISIL